MGPQHDAPHHALVEPRGHGARRVGGVEGEETDTNATPTLPPPPLHTLSWVERGHVATATTILPPPLTPTSLLHCRRGARPLPPPQIPFIFIFTCFESVRERAGEGGRTSYLSF